MVSHNSDNQIYPIGFQNVPQAPLLRTSALRDKRMNDMLPALRLEACISKDGPAWSCVTPLPVFGTGRFSWDESGKPLTKSNRSDSTFDYLWWFQEVRWRGRMPRDWWAIAGGREKGWHHFWWGFPSSLVTSFLWGLSCLRTELLLLSKGVSSLQGATIFLASFSIQVIAGLWEAPLATFLVRNSTMLPFFLLGRFYHLETCHSLLCVYY